MSSGTDSSDVAPDAKDGRRRRSEHSREQIVAALYKLIRDGEMNPGAAQVADVAGVSLRTVFRHFEEIDILYREMALMMEAEVLPIVMEPFVSATWRERLDELMERRARIYERVMPLKVAASVRRFQSKYLMDDYRRFLELEREGLKRVLPKAVLGKPVLFSALETALGFQAWRRMRQDQNLSARDAEKVMRFTVERLIADR